MIDNFDEKIRADKRVKIHEDPSAYDKLKIITDAAQEGSLSPWGGAVERLINTYGVDVARKTHQKIQVNLSFPKSTKNKSMAIGFRHIKSDESNAEDLYVFIETIGLFCFYRGSQEEYLKEYAGSHHAKIELQEFLPDIQAEIADIKKKMNNQPKSSNTNPVDIVTDAEFAEEIRQIDEDFKQKADSFARTHGNSSAPIAYSRALQIEATKKRTAIRAKKQASDRMYELELMDVEDEYNDKLKLKRTDLAQRNMLESGFGRQEIEDIAAKKERAIEKLNLKYGKTSQGVVVSE